MNFIDAIFRTKVVSIQKQVKSIILKRLAKDGVVVNDNREAMIVGFNEYIKEAIKGKGADVKQTRQDIIEETIKEENFLAKEIMKYAVTGMDEDLEDLIITLVAVIKLRESFMDIIDGNA